LLRRNTVGLRIDRICVQASTIIFPDFHKPLPEMTPIPGTFIL
jgi:hypothetical protein